MSSLRLSHSATDSAIISLVAGGRAATRAAIAQTLGWAPSTVSIHVQRLIDDGVLLETGTRVRGRGRPAVGLTLPPDGNFVVAVDLGGHHARLATMTLDGCLDNRAEVPADIADGPAAALEAIAKQIEKLIAAQPTGRTLWAVGLSLPGPVDTVQGIVTLPARMPGWDGFPVRGWLSERLGVPVLAENDANLMAYGEHVVRQDGLASTVTVKAGTGIGAGILVEGGLYRGATFAAGDITHYRVAAAGDAPCSCGNRGCLETVASGAALVATLHGQGVAVADTADIVRQVRQGDPAVTTAVRAAGASLGQVLCAVVNFFNPQAVYLGGLLPTVEPFVAAVRAQIYQGSHPLVTRTLAVERTISGADGVLVGGGRLAIEESFGGRADQFVPPEEVDA